MNYRVIHDYALEEAAARWPFSFSVPDDQLAEVEAWLDGQNLGPYELLKGRKIVELDNRPFSCEPYIDDGHAIGFQDGKDAMLFKLTWL